MEASRTHHGSPVEQLLERSRPQRVRRFSARERRVEGASVAGLVLAAAAIAIAFDGTHTPALWHVAGLLVLAAALSRVHVHVGGGSGVPTQLALVPMLFILPPAAVPVAVVGGLWLGTLPDVLTGRAPRERLLSAVADGWHAVAPALVFAVAGAPAADPGAWSALVLAFAAQALGDTCSGVLREWLGRGIAPSLQLRVMAQVYGLDAALTPVAFAVLLTPLGTAGWVLLVPLAVLFGALMADRRARIDEEAARADELTAERARLQAVMRRVGSALASNLDEDAMLEAVRDTAAEALASEIAFAGVPGGDGPELVEQVAALARHGSGTGILGTGDWHGMASRLGRSGAEQVLAVVRRGRPFTPQDLELLHHLAAHAAVSLENARLHARVRRQATTDELTGLANHRTLQRVLAEQLSGGERFAPRLSLLLLDIDDFKAVNDSWGHQQGDRVLRAVGEVLASRCRAIDRPARYGGEELAVVLPRTDAAGAARMAEDLRAAVEALEVPQPGGPPVRVTVSVGTATSPECGTTPSALVAAADAALYGAKRSGKNRVVAGAGEGVAVA